MCDHRPRRTGCVPSSALATVQKGSNVTVLARRSSIPLVFVLTCLAVALTVSAQRASSSSSYTSCHLSNHDKSPSAHGPTYLKRLRVKGGPTCSGAKTLVRDYYKCRTEGSQGPKDHCHHKVSGYSCSEVRSNKISTAFDANVTCSKRSRHVKHKYTQLTD